MSAMWPLVDPFFFLFFSSLGPTLELLTFAISEFLPYVCKYGKEKPSFDPFARSRL